MVHVNYNDTDQPKILKKDFLGSWPTFKNHNSGDVMQFYRKTKPAIVGSLVLLRGGGGVQRPISNHELYTQNRQNHDLNDKW